MTDLDLDPGTLIAWHPPRAVLELAELVVNGALDALPVEPSVPLELAVQVRSAGPQAGLALEDAEGTPVAALRSDSGGRWRVTPLRAFAHGPVRSARRAPAEVRAQLAAGAGPVLAVVVDRTLTLAQVKEAMDRERAGEQLLWIALIGQGWRHDLPAEALWRAVRDLADGRPAVPVAVPRGAGQELATAAGRAGAQAPAGSAAEDELVAAVVTAHGADRILRWSGSSAGSDNGELHPVFARELARAAPPPAHRGVTVFFTGLSGSGKSTVAKALADALHQDGRRTVSLLDGDEVRRLLSAGLSFSRADRDLNIRRIGFVATEITRHGGIAICAPIAPFAQVREEVRGWVGEVGDFLLVHVSTPLAECERRDRKGLYAKARQGVIPDFTGISSPYEVPSDADLTIDTTELSVPEAVDRVWTLLESRGYLGG